MKNLGLMLIFLCFSTHSYAEDQRFDSGRFSFSLSPKLLEDGSIVDIGLGLKYTNTWSGEIRFRNTAVSKNESLRDVDDSLNAVNETMYEVFFLPVKYSSGKTPALRLWAGGGLYYEYDSLEEKGFFNMPELEDLTPPRERVNSYTNDFSMHILGPLVDAGITYNAKWLAVSFSAGLVPVFFLHSAQKTGMVPLLDPHYAEYDQNTWGSPYFYLSLDSIIFKYVNLVLLYDFAMLNYKAIDFDSSLNWINPERKTVTHSFKVEASALLPLGGDIRAQLGYGFTFDSARVDSGTPVSGNRHYLIMTVKKSGG